MSTSELMEHDQMVTALAKEPILIIIIIIMIGDDDNEDDDNG